MTETTTSATRLRFAPSPTGFLHVGGARTALYNWLYARKHNAVFVLRIEDTDLLRSSEEMVQVILNSLQWLGLNWDEGPYFQSDRLELYRKAAFTLLEQQKAYRCFCKPEDLNARREAAVKERGFWKYERVCLRLTQDEIQQKLDSREPFAIRFLVAEGSTSFHDLVHGEISLDHGPVDDFVLLRSDGHPTYHLSVVVDDIDMKISHVIRGDDHISNTPKQLMLYNAFEVNPPRFAHLPLILGPDKKRLSKRHGSVAVEEYQNQGILPEALVNFLALLGWNPGDEREILSREELVQEFALEKVNSSNAVFDVKKLQWMNGKYLSSINLEAVVDRLKPFLDDPAWAAEAAFAERVNLMRTRVVNLVELAKSLEPFYRNDFAYDTVGLQKVRKDPGILELLESFMDRLSTTDPWEQQVLEESLRRFAEEKGIKASVLIHPIRLAVTGKTAGPGLFEILQAMGKENTLARLTRFRQHLKTPQET
jgi:nondiscriminating glutamyl-tRNA synthetase